MTAMVTGPIVKMTKATWNHSMSRSVKDMNRSLRSPAEFTGSRAAAAVHVEKTRGRRGFAVAGGHDEAPGTGVLGGFMWRQGGSPAGARRTLRWSYSRVEASTGVASALESADVPPLLTCQAAPRSTRPTTNETIMRTEWWPLAGVVLPKRAGRDPAGTAR